MKGTMKKKQKNMLCSLDLLSNKPQLKRIKRYTKNVNGTTIVHSDSIFNDFVFFLSYLHMDFDTYLEFSAFFLSLKYIQPKMEIVL